MPMYATSILLKVALNVPFRPDVTAGLVAAIFLWVEGKMLVEVHGCGVPGLRELACKRPTQKALGLSATEA